MQLLPLPATPIDVLNKVIVPSLEYLPAKLRGDPAKVELLSIAQQESGLRYRLQQPNGPAKGLFQFERGGGVPGVMTHPASQDIAQSVCRSLGVPFDEKAIYDALEFNDALAVAFARLLLWTDKSPLPAIGDADAAWNYYQRNWRPGKPHPEKWPVNYQNAVKAVTG